MNELMLREKIKIIKDNYELFHQYMCEYWVPAIRFEHEQSGMDIAEVCDKLNITHKEFLDVWDGKETADLLVYFRLILFYGGFVNNADKGLDHPANMVWGYKK